MEVKIGLSKTILGEVCESLDGYLANTYALYLKTQNFHWNVKGPQFFPLHLLFEKNYKELLEMIDEMAERIVSLGAHVDATFSGFSERSTIKESKKLIPAEQMIKELLMGHEALSAMGRPLVSRFQELHDDASSDMIIKFLAVHEKAAWMLRSHLE
jgi:starvation-inducible DNA-binding protein